MHMKKLYFVPIISVFVLVGVMNTLVSLVDAQEGTIGAQVQPALIEERVEPGETISSALRATNLSDETRIYHIVKRNITGLTITGEPVFAKVGEETEFEVSSWIRATEEPIHIAAGQTKEIPFSIAVPRNATPGSHFGGLFLSLTTERPKETGIGIGYQVGMIISLRVTGVGGVTTEVLEDARMREFSTNQVIYSKPDVTFIVRVENQGNVVVRPRGPLEITDFWGKKVATLTVNELGGAVLPKQIRKFETSWQGEGLAFGRYQVLLGLVYGEDGRKNISAALSFWVLPMNVILPFVGAVVGFMLFLFLFVKLYIKRKIKQLQSDSSGKSSLRRAQGNELSHHLGTSFSRLLFLAVGVFGFTLFLLFLLFLLFA
jgi:hypothetical protein